MDDMNDEWDDEWEKPYHSYYNSINEIIPGLFLSDYVAASNRNVITKNDIKKVISLGSYKNHNEYAVHDGIEYLFVFIDDHESEPIGEHFAECIKFIKSYPYRPVLVHCYAGISRSASIVIAYLISTGMSYFEAFRITKNKRPCINPNDGFIKQLEDFHNKR